MPLLSIIVPIYNVEKYLPKCIDSILAQTMADFELLLIDDGSPDRCGKICDEYAEKDSRIIVIHQENKGVSAARNAGLDIAMGEYIGFVDPDDYILPEMYEVMLYTAREEKAQVVACGFGYISEDGKYLRDGLTNAQTYQSHDEMLRAILDVPSQIAGSVCNKVFSAMVIRSIRFTEDLRIAEEAVFLFDICKIADKLVKIGNVLYHVRERSNSATRERQELLYFDILKSSKTLVKKARKYSKRVEGYALDKYLDDCLWALKGTTKRYSIRRIGIRISMIKTIIRAGLLKTLPKSKLHGYLSELI